MPILDLTTISNLLAFLRELQSQRDMVVALRAAHEFLGQLPNIQVAVLSEENDILRIVVGDNCDDLDIEQLRKIKPGEPAKISPQKWAELFPIAHFLLYIEKERPFSQSERECCQLIQEVFAMLENMQHWRKTIEPTKKTRRDLLFPYPQIIGESPALLESLQKLDKIIATELPVLIQGESGTGKELIARAIHSYGARQKSPFVSENCAAITETLLESELFGHVKGSFTGASQNKRGLFEIADRGTLFLDEVGDMSQGMQTKLLRALQEGEIRPIGGRQNKKVDVRIIAATNKNLRLEVENGRFREDLYYRLNVVSITLPPLRERGTDVLLLLDYFNRKISEEMGISPRPIADPVKECFCKHHWPGNIRELENEVRRMVALADDTISADLVSLSITEKTG